MFSRRYFQESVKLVLCAWIGRPWVCLLKNKSLQGTTDNEKYNTHYFVCLVQSLFAWCTLVVTCERWK